MLLPVATIELIYVDASGNTSAVVVNVPVSSSVTVMDAQATALASLIAPMTNAALVKIRHVYKAKLQADIIDAGSSPIVINGMFFLHTSDNNPMEVIAIPGFNGDLLLTIGPGAGYGIDMTNSEVVALLGGLIAANACNPFGELVIGIAAAYLQRRV